MYSAQLPKYEITTFGDILYNFHYFLEKLEKSNFVHKNLNIDKDIEFYFKNKIYNEDLFRLKKKYESFELKSDQFQITPIYLKME